MKWNTGMDLGMLTFVFIPDVLDSHLDLSLSRTPDPLSAADQACLHCSETLMSPNPISHPCLHRINDLEHITVRCDSNSVLGISSLAGCYLLGISSMPPPRAQKYRLQYHWPAISLSSLTLCSLHQSFNWTKMYTSEGIGYLGMYIDPI
jgi:hypothetical protein